MAVKNYGIFDKWLDNEQQNVVDVKSTDGVINSVKVNGQEYGGGGSSDFSTAEISISGESESQCSVISPHIIPTPFGYDLLLADSADYASGDSITVVLYNGKVSISASVESGSITVSGNIEHMDGNEYLITGDCTITIS